MARTLVNALAFGAALALVSVAADLAVSGPAHFGKFRVALHGASFTMAAIGAWAGFAMLRDRALAPVHAAMLGAGSGVAAFVAVLAAVRLGAFAALAAGLFAGCALVAYFGGRALRTPGD
jgi:hypothetical protein